MQRHEKVAKRKARRMKRIADRKERYGAILSKLGEALSLGLSIGQARQVHNRGYYNHSSGQLRQICSWQGTCAHPCNGDC